MDKSRENVVQMYPEQETEFVTQEGSKDRTIFEKIGESLPSAKEALSYSMLQITKAVFSLTLPVFLFIIGLLIIMTYIIFGVSAMMLIFSDHTAKSLEMLVMAVMMFLFSKAAIYILAWIKVKLDR